MYGRLSVWAFGLKWCKSAGRRTKSIKIAEKNRESLRPEEIRQFVYLVSPVVEWKNMENIYFSEWLTACLLPICQSVFLSVRLYVVPASLSICLPFWLSVCQSICLSVFLLFCPSIGLQLSAGCLSFLNVLYENIYSIFHESRCAGEFDSHQC